MIIYLAGAAYFGGQGIVNMGEPPLLRIYSAGDASVTPKEDITLAGGSDFRGVIVAPNAAVKITGNNALCGSVLGKDISNTGGAPVHYDESIRDTEVALGSYSVLAWHELPIAR